MAAMFGRQENGAEQEGRISLSKGSHSGRELMDPRVLLHILDAIPTLGIAVASPDMGTGRGGNTILYMKSGRRGPSLSPTPLGTGLETFASSGSGHSKPWLMSHSRSFTTIRLEFRRGSARMP